VSEAAASDEQVEGDSVADLVGNSADPWSAPGDSAAALVRAAVEAGSVEGHLALLVLTSGFTPGVAVDSPWATLAARLRAIPHDEVGLRSTTAVATAGLRVALGAPARADFAAAAHRELARERMPPAVCVRDDERLLLGVAAGVGAGAPELVGDVATITAQRRHTAPLRQACLDIWADALAAGMPRLSEGGAHAAYMLLTAPAPGRPTLIDEDRLVAFWLATRLLGAPWQPTDDQLAGLENVLDAGRRAVVAIASERRIASPFDASLFLDALSAAPATRLARRSALDDVLTVIEHFPASAAVVRTRYNERPPFTINDEYDVQDLFRALTLPLVPDITPEDPAPKVAGKSTRLDFTSRATRLGFELKHVKSPRHATAVREEVLLDERTYQEHPYVETVVVFIHDPNHFIAISDRPAFEADLSKTVAVDGRTVCYVVRVR
jgi:hypothetical protein